MTGILVNISATDSPLSVESEVRLFPSDQKAVAERELEQRCSEIVYKRVYEAVREAVAKLREDPESFVRLSDEIAKQHF